MAEVSVWDHELEFLVRDKILYVIDPLVYSPKDMVALRFRGLPFAPKEITLKANSGVKTGSALSANLQSIFLNALSSAYLGAVEKKVQNGFDISTIITDW